MKRILSHTPFLTVIILSIYPEEDYALKGFKEGGTGYLGGDSLPKDLTNAILQALSLSIPSFFIRE